MASSCDHYYSCSPSTHHHLLKISIIICFILLQFHIHTNSHPIPSPQQQQPLLVLPLKQQTLPQQPQPPQNPRKLSFRHNVSLTVSLTAGTPPQNVTMVLDTGSELSWLHCSSSSNNNNSNDRNLFNPLISSSYKPTPCSSSTCTTRTRDLPIPVSCDPKSKSCHVIVSYADATSTEGTLSSETFSIGGTPQPGTLFGCMDTGYSSDPKEDSRTTGLMGLNRGSLSFVAQLGIPKFSYCISGGEDSSGVLLFGGATVFPWLGPLQYTPLVKTTNSLPYFDRVAYTVQLEGIKVSEKLLQLPKSVFVPDHTGAGQTMVDSGTQFTFLLGSVYSALKNEFLAQTKGIALLKVVEDPNFVFQGAMDLCYRVNGVDGEVVAAAVPAVTMVFSGAEMRVSGERLLYKVAEEKTGENASSASSSSVYCFTFGNSDLLGIEAYVIGHHHQQNVWMEFDLVNSRVGFADTKCELAGQRLPLSP